MQPHSDQLPVYSMFVRVSSLMVSSLLTALAVAFAVMLLSLPINTALIIAIIVCMVRPKHDQASPNVSKTLKPSERCSVSAVWAAAGRR